MAQYNKTTGQLLADNKTLYEVVMLADTDGNPSGSNTGINVEFSGSTADAFGRGRVSEPHTLGDYKHTYNNVDDFFSVSTSGGAVNHTTHKACATLSTNTTATSRIIHQTKRYHHYLPGKSQLILTSFNFGANQNSSIKRIGYYDDLNGVFLENNTNALGVSSLRFILRRGTTGTGVDLTPVEQADWNQDPCNGTKSSFNLDRTKTQLVFIDFQWLGVGRVRVGFVHDGKMIVAHEFKHSNNLSEVYWSNPNLPIRTEVQNTAINTGASMDHICATAMSEGGYIEAGTDWEIQSPSAKLTIKPGGTWTPIIAIRLKNTFNGYKNRVLLSPENVSLFADTTSIAFRIGKVPSVASLTGTPTWTDANANSATEYSTDATGITLADFVAYGGGFLSAGNSNGGASTSQPATLTESKRNFITQNFDSTNSEVFVIMAKTLLTGANDQATVWASVQWKEII